MITPVKHAVKRRRFVRRSNDREALSKPGCSALAASIARPEPSTTTRPFHRRTCRGTCGLSSPRRLVESRLPFGLHRGARIRIGRAGNGRLPQGQRAGTRAKGRRKTVANSYSRNRRMARTSRFPSVDINGALSAAAADPLGATPEVPMEPMFANSSHIRRIPPYFSNGCDIRRCLL
jgi:hypothetical protein